jgi:hypothetical protein
MNLLIPMIPLMVTRPLAGGSAWVDCSCAGDQGEYRHHAASKTCDAIPEGTGLSHFNRNLPV